MRKVRIYKRSVEIIFENVSCAISELSQWCSLLLIEGGLHYRYFPSFGRIFYVWKKKQQTNFKQLAIFFWDQIMETKKCNFEKKKSILTDSIMAMIFSILPKNEKNEKETVV